MGMNIKYRVWLNAVREMRDVNLIDIKNGSVHVDGCYQNTSKLYDIVGDHSVPIMSSTGLFDKNGKEIFEGDIVEVAQYDCAVDRYINGSKHVVEWHSLNDYPAFDLTPVWDEQLNSFSSILNSDMFSIRVIGNIYENKELLK